MAQNIMIKNICHSYGGGREEGVLEYFQVRLDLFYLIGVDNYIRVICSLYFIYILDEAVTVGLALA